MIRRNVYEVPSFGGEEKKIIISGGDYTLNCYGYKERDGKIIPVPAAGEEEFPLGGEPTDIKHVPTDIALCILSGGECISLDLSDGSKVSYGTLSLKDGFIATALDEANKICHLFIGGNECLRVYGENLNSATSISLGYKLYRGVMHCHRLFAIDYDDRLKIRWTGYDTLDFTEDIFHGGYIELFEEGGKALSIYEYGDDVLVLREGGITVIHALGDPRNYRIASAQKLVRAQNIVCGGGELNGLFWFCCEDGIYSFDGEDIKRQYFYPLSGTIKFKNSVVGGGRVYAEVTFDGEAEILCYCPQDECGFLFLKGCGFPAFLGGKLSCVKNSSLCYPSLSFADGERLWRSVPLLNGARQKLIKSVTADCDDGVIITVYCDGEGSVYTGAGEHMIKKRALYAYLEISGEGETRKITVTTKETK